MKRLNFNIKDRKVLTLGLCIILVCVFTLTIAYAALSVTLNIVGNAEVVASSWDIKLANPKVRSGSVNNEVPTISGNTLNFNTTLNTPGDFYEFTVDVVNNGSIDAVIENVVKNPELTVEQAKYLKYEITYQNGEAISNQQLLAKNTTMPIKVRIEYRKDLVASDLPSTNTTLNMSLTLEYTQSNGDDKILVENNGKLIKIFGVDGTNTNDVVCIGEECFFVMYSDEETVTMLAEYNLYVGGEYVGSTWTAYGEEATGKQDSEMNVFKGITPFSNTNYWSVNNSKNIYNENSILYGYVENYKTYLSTLGVTPIEARLITYEELTALGCSGSMCSSAPTFITSTSYWSGSFSDSYSIWSVDGGRFDGNNYSAFIKGGCRPVVVISKDLIDSSANYFSVYLIEFTIDSITYYAEYDMTWAEWVDSEYNIDGFYIEEVGNRIIKQTDTGQKYVINQSTIFANNVILSDRAYRMDVVSSDGSSV